MREPEIAFACPGCGRETVAGLSAPAVCRACATETALPLSASLRGQRIVDECPCCTGRQMYVQRDFNQRAGLAIVVLGAVFAPFTPFYASLFAAAALDALLYVVLPEITICYRCGAHFRRFRRNASHQPFDLHVAEQYSDRRGAGERD